MIRKVSKDSVIDNTGTPLENKPLIAIVGRPNVGKSRLFNRLVGARKAIVQDTPGVTRDRIIGEMQWGRASVHVMDTGGIELDTRPTGLSARIRSQIEKAVTDADLLLFMVDGRAPVHPQDHEIIQLLRKTAKPIVCAVNKIDTAVLQAEDIHQYHSLGLSPLWPISAEHGIGIDDLLDALIEQIPFPQEGSPDTGETSTTRLAVVGRPNVGKSTWVNTLLGEERQLVDEQPGTTRDAIDTPFTWKDKSYLLIDTAGIRRKGKTKMALEKFSVIKALQSLDRCDVAMLLIDAVDGVTDQDGRVGSYILEKGKGAVILVNKWDLVQGKGISQKQLQQQIRDGLPHLKFAPVVPISALKGHNINKAMQTVNRVEKAYRRQITTGPLNRFLEDALKVHPPPLFRYRRRRIYYMTQLKNAPPTFILFTNYSKEIPVAYQRYLVNQLRNRFGFEGAPIKLVFRKKR